MGKTQIVMGSKIFIKNGQSLKKLTHELIEQDLIFTIYIKKLF